MYNENVMDFDRKQFWLVLLAYALFLGGMIWLAAGQRW
jgi:hypothetical protein